jgi:hypothetical protein
LAPGAWHFGQSIGNTSYLPQALFSYHTQQNRLDMRKTLLLAIFLGIAGWRFLVGGRTITEDQVRDFYRTQEAATLSRQPEALCALLDDQFKSTGTVSMQGSKSLESQDKSQACSGLMDLYRTWADLGDKMGGLLQLDSNYTIHRLSISPDGRSATAEVSTTLNVGGSMMSISSHTTDTLIRRNGVVKLLRSEGHGSIGVGS